MATLKAKPRFVSSLLLLWDGPFPLPESVPVIIIELWTIYPDSEAERAQYDLDTADAMFKAGRYLYVLFCCQQAVEKVLKAVIVRKTGTLPPRIHNLLRLAEVAGIEPDQDQVRFLGELSGYYIQSRYPEEIRVEGSTITQGLASKVLGKTEQTMTWVLSIPQ